MSCCQDNSKSFGVTPRAALLRLSVSWTRAQSIFAQFKHIGSLLIIHSLATVPCAFYRTTAHISFYRQPLSGEDDETWWSQQVILTEMTHSGVGAWGKTQVIKYLWPDLLDPISNFKCHKQMRLHEFTPRSFSILIWRHLVHWHIYLSHSIMGGGG